jgi:autoinducer 2-degrading protein
MYIVHVDIQVQPGHEQDFLAASIENSRNTRQEPGNLRFDVCRHEEDASRFMFYEAYRTKADFQAHQQTEHYKRWRAAIDGIMAKPRVGTRWSNAFPLDADFA